MNETGIAKRMKRDGTVRYRGYVTNPDDRNRKLQGPWVGDLSEAVAWRQRALMGEVGRPNQRGDGYVYFVQAGSGPIKIGWSKGHPTQRMAQLQSTNHEKLHLLGFLPGRIDEELSLHKRLREFRIRGEWFWPVAAVLAAVPQNNVP